MQHNEAPTKERLYGNIASLLHFAVNFNDAGIAAGVKKFTVAATAANPVLIEAFAEIETAFNAGTTNDLVLGSDAAQTIPIIATSSVTEGTIGFYPTTADRRYRAVAPFDIFVKYSQTGTAATAGKAHIYVRLTPLTQPANPVSI
jgi:hypothetical protein